MKLMSERNIIYYDVSRLIKRLLESTPTGIDRVDFEYATYLLGQKEYVVEFISQGKRSYLIVPRTFLTKVLALVNGATHHQGIHFNKTYSRVRYKLKIYLYVFFYRILRWLNIFGVTLRPEGLWSRKYNRKYYVNVSHAKLLKPWRLAWLNESGVRSIFFLHDLIPVRYPQYCTSSQEQRHKRRLGTIIKFADEIIVNSFHTKADLENYIVEEKMGARSINVLPLSSGISLLNMHRESFNEIDDEEKCFVILSTIEPRKNHIILLNVWRRLISELGVKTPKLIIIGNRGWGNDDVFELLDNDEYLKKFVFEYSGLCDEEIVEILLRSTALLSPSFVEGYGLPVLEALSLKVPVLASKIPAHVEIGQGVPEYIDPNDFNGWYESVLDYIKDDSVRKNSQLARMNSFRPPTWPDHMQLFTNVLHSIVDHKR